MNKKYLTTMEVAKLLNISRIAVFKKIKKGDIRAIKIGGRNLIDSEQISNNNAEKDITKSVNRVVREYGETIKLLGDE